MSFYKKPINLKNKMFDTSFFPKTNIVIKNEKTTNKWFFLCCLF